MKLSLTIPTLYKGMYSKPSKCPLTIFHLFFSLCFRCHWCEEFDPNISHFREEPLVLTKNRKLLHVCKQLSAWKLKCWQVYQMDTMNNIIQIRKQEPKTVPHAFLSFWSALFRSLAKHCGALKLVTGRRRASSVTQCTNRRHGGVTV